ncbi:MAG: stage II sporulation protein P [Bacillota bacterium]|nr:stage II sporulation protein P [Bacillota bacterium]
MKDKSKILLAVAIIIFLCSTVFFLKLNPVSALTSVLIDEKQLGELCIGQVNPTSEASGPNGADEDKAPEGGADDDAEKSQQVPIVEEEPQEEQQVTVTGDPLVIIYHTHGTESYMPHSESNYHREAEDGTVREVGTVLENELKKKGINVVHDKTIHDRPSYNESYTRSLATIKSLMAKYPTAVYVIDLHRDAAASSATEGKYLEIDGQRVAKFSLVVGKANENYVELYDYAQKVSQTAESLYKGYGGPIIEKEYNYNGYVSNKAILLEVGNNKNTIDEAKLSAKYFAEVMAKIIGGQ